MRYKNQYLISDSEVENFPLNEYGFKKVLFKDYFIYHSQSLPITIEESNDIKLLLLGFIFNPLSPQADNNEILKEILKKAYTKEDLFKEFDRLTGRYVIFVILKNEHIAFSDCCAQRQLFFFSGNTNVFTSSPPLALNILGIQPHIPASTATLLCNREYISKGSPWFGNTWYDERFNKVLPNHYLNTKYLKTYRIPFEEDYEELGDLNMILQYAIETLQGSLSASNYRYSPHIPVTAGIDSRLIVAASKSIHKVSQYYLFARSESETKNEDSVIAKRLAEKLNFQFKVHRTTKPSEEFLKRIQQDYLFPRQHNSIIENIYFHFLNNEGNIINLSGSCGEIIRSYYGSDIDIRNKLLNISGNDGFFHSSILKWLDAIDPKSLPVSVGDLFYWEQRMGNWGAQYPYEQDIAIEQFSPFNHKKLILLLYSVPEKLKRQFLLEISEEMWPGSSGIPINPIFGLSPKKRLANLIRNNDMLYKLYLKFKQ